MNIQEKMENVKAVLKEIESMVADHLEDGGDLDIPAIELVKSAVEIYEEVSENGEG